MQILKMAELLKIEVRIHFLILTKFKISGHINFSLVFEVIHCSRDRPKQRLKKICIFSSLQNFSGQLCSVYLYYHYIYSDFCGNDNRFFPVGNSDLVWPLCSGKQASNLMNFQAFVSCGLGDMGTSTNLGPNLGGAVQYGKKSKSGLLLFSVKKVTPKIILYI